MVPVPVLVQVWDPFVPAGDARREGARRVEGFLAYSPAEAHQVIIIRTALPKPCFRGGSRVVEC